MGLVDWSLERRKAVMGLICHRGKKMGWVGQLDRMGASALGFVSLTSDAVMWGWTV